MLTAYSSRELLNITIYNTGEGIVDFLLNVGSGISGNIPSSLIDIPSSSHGEPKQVLMVKV